MHRQILRINLLIAGAMATAYFALADDAVTWHPKVKPPKFTLRAAAATALGDQEFITLGLEVSNPNNASLTYTGYAPDSFAPSLTPGHIAPLFQIELQRDGEWQRHPIGFCGTGLTDLELTPGDSATFAVAVPADKWQRVKVGIGHFPGWSNDEVSTTTVWSAEFMREEIEKARNLK